MKAAKPCHGPPGHDQGLHVTVCGAALRSGENRPAAGVRSAGPEKFTNVTNGVTPRRWVALANPESALLDEHVGPDWISNMSLRKLEERQNDQGFLELWGNASFR